MALLKELKPPSLLFLPENKNCLEDVTSGNWSVLLLNGKIEGEGEGVEEGEQGDKRLTGGGGEGLGEEKGEEDGEP